MFNIVLYQPEIPPNTGNIIRLCANTGCYLHLIEPLGFELDDKKLRRAGLDYHEWADVQIHTSLDAFTAKLGNSGSGNVYALTTRGQRNYYEARYLAGDSLIFGPETRGLPQEYLDSLAPLNTLRLPMLKNSRSLNLSNTAAIVVYEALRQTGFKGMG
ncbi:MAG: tRNA (uridine(34)/cytosine(34)/5-carboxymethylaminomethyluridine(34)-2'-O)-methyltransferase TrmL [Gammaproteobacteria bacterium]|nr:tRNA (uridine(34)/cytosine(34)/5-carboxymethylaminomethyluridine(34)-2'-O)-methyltransferase TrmL [Gammaproteobacteria bacterium]